MLLILRTSLEKLQNDINSFTFNNSSGYRENIIQSRNGELVIKHDYSSDYLYIGLGGYSGKHYNSIFKPWSWKSMIIFNKMRKILENKEQAIEQARRLQYIYKHFPELVNQEFEEQVLLKDE